MNQHDPVSGSMEKTGVMISNPVTVGVVKDNSNVLSQKKIENHSMAVMPSPAKISFSGSLPGSLPSVSVSAKMLPNIQPKVPVQASGIPIMPKQAQSAAPMGNVVIPTQTPLHVLINGQVYPVIQTANGAHLIIQQPLAQLAQQPAAKAVGAPSVVGLGPIPVQQSNVVNTASMPSSQCTSVSSQANTSAAQHAPNAPASNLSEAVRSNTPTSASKSHSPISSLPQPMQPNQQVTAGAINNAVIDPQMLNLLTKLQSQISALRSVPNADDNSKTKLDQLVSFQQQLIQQLRNQQQQRSQDMHMQSPANSQLSAFGMNRQVALAAHGTPSVPTTQQLNNHQSNNHQPNSQGEQVTTTNSEHLLQLLAAFSMVKIGQQVYNIQLAEPQRQAMLEQLAKLPPQQQQEYIVQQQMLILNNALKNAQLQIPHQVAQPSVEQLVQPLSFQSAQAQQQGTTQAIKIQQSSISGSQPKRARPGQKAVTNLSASAQKSNALQDSADLLIPSTVESLDRPLNIKPKPEKSKRSRPPTTKSKAPSYRFVDLLQKDQEAIQKGIHKKAFASRVDACQRLMKYHIFYTPNDPLESLEDDMLFDSVADKLIAKKVELENRFVKMLWRDSITSSLLGEDYLISELLLKEEEEALERDKRLLATDIEQFRQLYTEPEPLSEAVEAEFTDHPSSPKGAMRPRKSRGRLIRGQKWAPGKRKSSPLLDTGHQDVSQSKDCTIINKESNILYRNQCEYLEADVASSVAPMKSHTTETEVCTTSVSRPCDVSIESQQEDACQIDNDEDELIDIDGSPPSVISHSREHSPFNSTERNTNISRESDSSDHDSILHESSSSPSSYHHNSSSPIKQFAIFSETVVEQSEQADIGYQELVDKSISDACIDDPAYDDDSTDLQLEQNGEPSPTELNNQKHAMPYPAIAPLRINRKQLEQYSWSQSVSPRSQIDLPPIKLRIKKQFDRWETSSVSSLSESNWQQDDELSEKGGDDSEQEDREVDSEESCKDEYLSSGEDGSQPGSDAQDENDYNICAEGYSTIESSHVPFQSYHDTVNAEMHCTDDNSRNDLYDYSVGGVLNDDDYSVDYQDDHSTEPEEQGEELNAALESIM